LTKTAVKDYFLHIKEAITHKITADFIVLFAGRLTASGIGFFIGIIVARSLGPAEFGLYSIAMVIFQISVVIAEMGIGMSIVRFVPLYRKKDPQRAEYYLMVGFWLLLGLAVSVTVIGLSLSKTIALGIYGKSRFIDPVRLGFLAVIGGVLWSYYLASLQSRELFKKYSFSSIFIGILKLALLALALYTIGLTAERVIWITIIASVTGFLAGKFYAPVKHIGVHGELRKSIREMMNFSKWIFIMDLTVMLFSHLDVLMLGYFESEKVVGYYSVAFNIIFIFTIMISSLNNVLLPIVCKYQELGEFKRYIRKILSLTTATALVLLPVFFLLGPAIRLLFGDTYIPSIAISQIMFFGFLFNLVVEPIYLVSYAANKPQIIAFVGIVKLALNAISNFILIPIYGAMGAAVATVVTHAVGGIIAIFLIRTLIFKKERPKLRSD
jgi:O-antigen/teichoic acid export membrane protein